MPLLPTPLSEVEEGGEVENMIKTKRVYENADAGDGARFLVERLWPRGMWKEDLVLDSWVKDVAPSGDLRRWFAHDPAKWEEFRKRYFAELNSHVEAWQPLVASARKDNVTLLYSAKDTEHNNAVALKEYLQEHLAS
jgi:uncharacterized protein YeaO (DUF488 family)